jgi:hypothetical protein
MLPFQEEREDHPAQEEWGHEGLQGAQPASQHVSPKIGS